MEHENRLSVLKELFLKMTFLRSGDTMSAPEPRKNDAHNEDHTEVLLSHVKLYIFAEEKDIQPLRRFALAELHKTLSIFVITPESTRDLTTTIRYAYEHTVRLLNAKEAMREVLSRYVGCMIDKLVAVKDFQALLSQIQEFAEDFCEEVDRYFVKRTNELL